MPVITIVCNKVASSDAKRDLLTSVSELVAATCHIPTGHVHLYIQDGAFFAFGGDVDTAAAYVTVKSSALQILPEGRRGIVRDLMPILSKAFPDLLAERVNTLFEELPVENIAVGTSIATFAISPTAITGRASIGGAPGRA